MRVHLKGLNHSTKRLADGRRVTYWYAWRNGPLLPGEPGSPEFMAAYNEAVAAKVAPRAGVLQSILQRYQDASEFTDLAERTRRDYAGLIRLIEAKFGDFPLAALSDRRTRGIFLEWRDNLAVTSRRQADYAWTVLARVLSWALHRRLIDQNPCEKGGRLYRGSRAEKIWTSDDEALFLARAPDHLHLPLLLALWTGQRQGDLLRLAWVDYDGTHIRLTQRKSGLRKVRVVIPVGAPLKAALKATPKRSPLILTNLDGKPMDAGWLQVLMAQSLHGSWRVGCHVP
jgi:integrase